MLVARFHFQVFQVFILEDLIEKKQKLTEVESTRKMEEYDGETQGAIRTHLRVSRASTVSKDQNWDR